MLLVLDLCVDLELVYLVLELVYLVDLVHGDRHLRLEALLLKVRAHLYVLAVDILVFDHLIFDRLISL